MSQHPFDTAIALRAAGDDRWHGATSPAYANFIGPFGGVTAAQVINAVLQHPSRLGEPVALTVNFAAALGDGEFEVIARPVRTNRSTQHWTIAVEQKGETVVTATAFTAVRRETWQAAEVLMPDTPMPSDVPRPEGNPGVEWVRRYDMRFIEGGLPKVWDGKDSGISRTRLWVRDVPGRTLDFASLTSMSDIFFPRLWLRRATFVPIGTVSMTVYFHAGEAQLRETGTGWLLGEAQGQSFRAGYFDHSAHLWNEAGALLVSTHQVVYFKE
jgi:acyl-CoA thioesterase